MPNEVMKSLTIGANTYDLPQKTSDLTNDSGFLTSFTETDPVFTASAASNITSTNITNWNNKISEPASEGTNGQVLTTDGNGGRNWETVSTTDTKNTAGSTDTSSKIYLIGATSQATNPQTYSHNTAYVGTDGHLYSNNTKVKVVQTAISSPSANGSTTAFIDTISQDANGVIAVTKKNLDTSGTWSGNAGSATKLATARNINGTSFDGTANITTTTWGTARNIYISDSDGSNTGAAVSVNGSNNATLKLPSAIKTTLISDSNSYGETLPASGTTGQIFFQTSDPYYELPGGGTAGQALIKNSASDRDVTWGNVDALPTQTGNSGKFLTTNGTTASWGNVDALPTQSGNSGKFLTTNGTTASWATANYVAKTGDTMTGDLTLQRTTTIANNTPASLNFKTIQSDNSITTTAYIKVYDDGDNQNYGTNMVITSNGNMIVGSGESPTAFYTNAIHGKTANANTGVGANAIELNEAGENLILTSDGVIYFETNCSTIANRNTSYLTGAGYLYCTKVYGAVWNDYAEYRQADSLEPGRCVVEKGDDTLTLSSKRMQSGAEIISDTFGFAIGQTDKAQTPIAVSGRVLAYPYESLEEFKNAIGRPVCSGPNGTVSIMTDEEYQKFGYCAIGTISAVPEYETWGENNVAVNNRVWIRVR